MNNNGEQRVGTSLAQTHRHMIDVHYGNERKRKERGPLVVVESWRVETSFVEDRRSLSLVAMDQPDSRFGHDGRRRA